MTQPRLARWTVRFLIVGSVWLSRPAAPLHGQSVDSAEVEAMPPYGSKEVDQRDIEIPGYSGPENERALIVMGCQNAVRARLRAPTMAKFARGPAVLTDDHKITVMGRVEAMNSMGGYGLMRYECVGAKGKDSWIFPTVTLDDLFQR